MILYLIPFQFIGEFKLDNHIDEYLDKIEYSFSDDIDDIGLVTYHIDSLNISLYVNKKNGVIESISCKEECLYKGRNLIGMSLDEFISHTEENYVGEVDEVDFEDDNIPQYVYDFDTIGLQVWIKNDKVVTIIASSFKEE